LTQPLDAFIALIPKILVAIVLIVIGAVVRPGGRQGVHSRTPGGLSYGSMLGTAAAELICSLS
jgi:hypothetical protein